MKTTSQTVKLASCQEIHRNHSISTWRSAREFGHALCFTKVGCTLFALFLAAFSPIFVCYLRPRPPLLTGPGHLLFVYCKILPPLSWSTLPLSSALFTVILAANSHRYIVGRPAIIELCCFRPIAHALLRVRLRVARASERGWHRRTLAFYFASSPLTPPLLSRRVYLSFSPCFRDRFTHRLTIFIIFIIKPT